MSGSILTTLVILPLVAALIAALMPGREERVLKGLGVVSTLIIFLVSCAIYPMFKVGRGAIQMREYAAWLPEYGINWSLGLDGISLFLVLLTTFLMPLIMLGSWNSIKDNVKGFVVAMLVLESAVIGTFVSLNLFFFFVFWEAMLIPMVLIIGVWGSGSRIKSAIKFFLYTAVGSLLMLVAILVLYRESYDQLGGLSLNYSDLLRLQLPLEAQIPMFAAFALAFCIKVPLFPLHTWLPDAHTDAPTPGSVILAGVLLKLGTYGLIRFAIPLFPDAAIQLAPTLIGLSVAGIIFGALVAWVQKDIKKLIAYSSVSHMGFVVLGLFVLNNTAATGAVLQMLSHGISTGALFLLVGIIYERRHTRELDQYGGLAAVMPRYAVVFLIATLSSIGLPGLNGFVGEFMILLGSFQSGMDTWVQSRNPVVLYSAVAAASGVILGAIYMLTLYLKMFFGQVTRDENRNLPDLTVRESLVLAPLVFAMFAVGIYPDPLLKRISPSVEVIYSRRVNPEQPVRAPAEAKLDRAGKVVASRAGEGSGQP